MTFRKPASLGLQHCADVTSQPSEETFRAHGRCGSCSCLNQALDMDAGAATASRTGESAPDAGGAPLPPPHNRPPGGVKPAPVLTACNLVVRLCPPCHVCCLLAHSVCLPSLQGQKLQQCPHVSGLRAIGMRSGCPAASDQAGLHLKYSGLLEQALRQRPARPKQDQALAVHPCPRRLAGLRRWTS
jgi:hypothetical protein